MSNKKLVLIDGHALAYRMYFALPLDAFTTKAGEPTNATYGFTRTILDLILADEPPQYLAVSFDVGATFRDDLFAEYKGTREKMPDELALQIERIREVVRSFNIPVLELDGYEADDVLGTVADQAKAFDVPVYIITGDRDLLQLVDENTQVELPAAGRDPEVYDEPAVFKRLGVRPDQVVDYKAMVGDTSDNIPGVKGVGQKTAEKLLAEYQTLDGIYNHIEELKGAVKKRLEDGKEAAYLSYQLAKIVRDAPIQLNIEACVAQEYDPAEVLELFRALEFRSLTKRISDTVEEDIELTEDAAQPTETIIVRTQAQLDALVKALEKAKEISFDVETTALDERTAELVGICLAVNPPTGYYVPVGHLAGEAQASSGQMALFAGEAQLAEGQLPFQTVLDALKPALTNPKIPKIAHNAKYDYAVLEKYGIEVAPLGFDTMIGEWLTDPSSKHLGLKNLSFHRLGMEMTEITSLIGKGKTQTTFAEVDIEQAAPYGAADADITLRLAGVLRPELEKMGLINLMDDLELPLIPVLAAMEKFGVGVDVPFFKQMSKELQKRLEELEKQIFDIAGEPFNINSTQQLSDILFMKLKLPHEGLRKTKSGYFSTAADVLEGLRPSDETGIVDAITEHRELVKLKSTYVDALPVMVNEKTGRIHTSYSQTGAITGRIASSNPNLQNIPIRTEVGQQIRRGFVSRPGWLFLAVDYSQVELRVLAHISQDEALLAAFREDQDIHRTTAAAVYNIPVEEVTYNQRRFAKAVNFGLIYGMGAFRLARDSELTLAEAENYIAAYFDRFPGINRYLEETKTKAKKQGYVETLLGRRRYFPIFKAKSGVNRQIEMRAEREAVNHPIQGTAADIIKIAMIRLHDRLTADYQARLMLQVHDELVLEVPEEELDAVRPLVRETMSNAFKLDVPLKVEASTGKNWLELKD